MKNDYEKVQDFNFITRILHSTRYRNLEHLFREIAAESGKVRVVDIGCGVAKVYGVLIRLGLKFDYVGIEINEDYADIARERYGNNENFSILCDSIENACHYFDGADIVVGLESFEHIPEPIVVRVVEALGQSSCKYIYITVPNEIGPAILIKNIGFLLIGYSRYKEYSWKETLAAGLYNLDKVERHGAGHKGFDWRWLAHTLRQNCRIIRYTTSPLSFIPNFISPSIGFVCMNDKEMALI